MAVRFLLFVLFWTWLSFTAPVAMAAGRWEAAILFLSSADDSADYHRDVDANILELARLMPGQNFRLTLHRELNEKSVQYSPDPSSTTLNAWDNLFFEVPVKGIQIPGEMAVENTKDSIINSSGRLKSFFQRAFRIQGSKRLLVIQTHGFGPKGIKQANLKALQTTLQEALPAGGVDLFWLDSCLMSNLEALYQLRNISPLIIASQDTEFSAGAPFEALSALADGNDDVKAQALFLASRFIESYSILEEGSQRRAVFSSAATVSVIETKSLEPLAQSLKVSYQNIKTLAPELISRLRKQMPSISMEMGNLVDLGSLLLKIPTEKAARGILEVGSIKARKTNPRIALVPPTQGQRAVYGWENWQRGHQNDSETLEKIPKELTPSSFLAGPGNFNWPSRTVNKRLYVAPFAPGLNQFSVYFTDGTVMSTPKHYRRKSDYVTRNRKAELNPIIFSGYTQSIGKTSEKYTGLSVSNPFMGIPSFDYMDLDFFAVSGWTK